MKRKYVYITISIIVILLIINSYTVWNRLDPGYTCAGCHEITPSHTSWAGSAHAEIHCVECHGTALSNGFHSFKEKAEMVTVHFTDKKNRADIHLTEEQVLEVVNKCIRCHQAEHAGWQSSGHAANYREIFMDDVHNAIEKPHWDCLRCHGMFYNGGIYDLMNLEGKSSSYVIKDKKQELRPTIPCLACHQIHTGNPVSKRQVPMKNTSAKTFRNTPTAFYMRADKMYLRSDKLTPVVMKDDDRPVNRAIDTHTLLCQQCHAPDYVHKAGSEDDRTPTGVHEGISCTACHKVHSGDTRESCVQCHSGISTNCKKDVRQMNTTYLSKVSSHDIHRITCLSCHP